MIEPRVLFRKRKATQNCFCRVFEMLWISLEYNQSQLIICKMFRVLLKNCDRNKQAITVEKEIYRNGGAHHWPIENGTL